MNRSKTELWERFQKYYTEYPSINLALDLSRMNFPDDFFTSMEGKMQKAFKDMAELERGAIANPDENRMVGHYWLRNPALSPTSEIRKEIEDTIVAIKAFAEAVHTGKIRGEGGIFKNLLVIGIGGSALGPQFVSRALGHPKTDKVRVFFFDNTDPDGMDQVLAQLDGELNQTICLVISKSGGTKETRNGMLEAEYAYRAAKLAFAKHAVAITGKGSELDKFAKKNAWVAQFPMWDWVGGRTSEMSAVGLLPAAIQGIDIDGLTAGAKVCDEATRTASVHLNPAAKMALMWYHSGNGNGSKSMVVLPYKDRLEMFSKYLQQLIMESLGKERNLNNQVVNQGLSVYGNKGATDQHSYIQQLRDGINNFFAVFIEVSNDRSNKAVFVEDGVTSGDFLIGFFLGTREALYENGRESITITMPKVSAFSVGVLIALFERSVGLYASLININAYHQPGVESGKKAAQSVIDLQKKVIEFLQINKCNEFTVNDISLSIGAHESLESIFKICRHLAANGRIDLVTEENESLFTAKYCIR
ncbi:MAG: glucose-6-phosphate isomerase [Verrucomicrobia bacterium]|nr:glucose-6-phosphate isomerase [Verrucomicrobiota bacterium]